MATNQLPPEPTDAEEAQYERENTWLAEAASILFNGLDLDEDFEEWLDGAGCDNPSRWVELNSENAKIVAHELHLACDRAIEDLRNGGRYPI